MAQEVYSLWLMPDAASKKRLDEVHLALSNRFGAPRFDVHMTLIGGAPMALDHARERLDAVVAGIAPFTDQIQAITLSRQYFRSFYALFPAGGPILELKTRATRLILGEGIGAFTPHVSLLYGAVEPVAKAEAREAAAAALEGESIRFDAVTLALSSDTIPISDWKIVHTACLG